MPSPGDIRTPLPSEGRLHRVGKLRAGVKKTSTKSGALVEYPSAVDYFVVNADASTSEQSATSFHRIYGEEPRELDVVLPADTPDEVLQGAWRLYGTGGLLKRKCEGPGGACQERGADGEWIYGPCACDREHIPLDDKRRCQARWTLSVLLMNVAGLGVWQFDTGSEMAARDLAGMLNLIYGLRGTLLRAECKLRLVPRQVSPKGVAKTVYVAQLDASGVTPAEALALAEGGASPLPQLPPPILDEAPDELLDHGRMETVAVPPPPPPPPTRPAPPTPAEPGARAVALQLRDLPLEDREDLYRLAAISRGTKLPQVREALIRRWSELELMPFDYEPDVGYLLNELRIRESEPAETQPTATQRLVDEAKSLLGAEEETPGEPARMYGRGDPT